MQGSGPSEVDMVGEKALRRQIGRIDASHASERALVSWPQP
jgi:hypothetical protein